MAERVGFQALYLSGGGVALHSLGMPDLAVTTLSDVVEDARRITRVVDGRRTPLLVDADTGFGGALSVARTVKDMEAIGVAGVHIEDQVAIKRCGHRPNKEVVSPKEMVARLRAACDARTSDDFFIMARTDAVGVEGMDAAIERARLYVSDGGADAIFAEALTSLEQYKVSAFECNHSDSTCRRLRRSRVMLRAALHGNATDTTTTPLRLSLPLCIRPDCARRPPRCLAGG